jgi:hypothetical protein
MIGILDLFGLFNGNSNSKMASGGVIIGLIDPSKDSVVKTTTLDVNYREAEEEVKKRNEKLNSKENPKELFWRVIQIGLFAEGGNIHSDIERYKKQLITKAKSKGLYENFGQNEVRKLEDKYGYTNEVRSFDDWAMNFDLSQLKQYAKGGEIENELPIGTVYSISIPNSRESSIYTVISDRGYSYSSDANGNPINKGISIIHKNFWLGETPKVIKRIDLESVTRNIGGKKYTYYLSGNKSIDNEMANLDARWVAFSNNATKAQKAKYDEQEEDNYHIENAIMITKWFNSFDEK